MLSHQLCSIFFFILMFLNLYAQKLCPNLSIDDIEKIKTVTYEHLSVEEKFVRIDTQKAYSNGFELIKVEKKSCDQTHINRYLTAVIKIDSFKSSLDSNKNYYIIPIHFIDNCCISAYYSIKKYKDSLLLNYEIAGEASCSCQCLHRLNIWIKSNLFLPPKISLNGKLLEYRPPFTPDEFEIEENGDTINYIDHYGVPQGIHKYCKDGKLKEIRFWGKQISPRIPSKDRIALSSYLNIPIPPTPTVDIQAPPLNHIDTTYYYPNGFFQYSYQWSWVEKTFCRTYYDKSGSISKRCYFRNDKGWECKKEN